MSITDTMILIVAPIVMGGSFALIVSSIRRRMNTTRSELEEIQNRITFNNLMMYNRRHGLSLDEVIIPDKKYQTLEERRIEFERKNKEDWDSYHDPSRYMR